MSTAVKRKAPTWPVVEIFGPTVQGEGVDQGVASHFVRFGGCDFRCTWCDTPYAVLPNEVRANAQKMNSDEILVELFKLGGAKQAPWVILTGGNPALLDLTDLVERLHLNGFLVAVETQGTRWREWMSGLDRVCVSPKPPSAKQAYDFAVVHRFMHEGMLARAAGVRPYEWLFLKVVIFDDADLDFAITVRKQLSDALLYLSAGNDAGRTVGNPERRDDRAKTEVQLDLIDKALWLTEEVFKRPELCAPDVIVQAQFHVLLWGNEKGR